MLSLPQARELLRESGLPPVPRLILLAVASYTNGTADCWPSVAELAEVTGAGERTVRRVLGELAAAEHITITRKPGGCNTYRLLAHPCHSGTPAAVAPLPERHPEGEDLDVPLDSPPEEGIEVGSTSPCHSGTPATAAGVDVTPIPKPMSTSGLRREWRRWLVAERGMRQGAPLPEFAVRAIARGELPDGSNVPELERGPAASKQAVAAQGGQERPRFQTAAEKREQRHQENQEFVLKHLAERRARREQRAKEQG